MTSNVIEGMVSNSFLGLIEFRRASRDCFLYNVVFRCLILCELFHSAAFPTGTRCIGIGSGSGNVAAG